LAVVTAQELNVRAGPSPETAIVTKLLQGQRLLVRPGDGPWANVVVLVDGKMVEGWVNRSYITAAVPNGVAPAPAVPPNVFAQPPAVSPGFSYPDPLTIDSADLDCDEDFVDGGFSRCTVEISISLIVPRIYADLMKDYVDVECEASVSFEAADGFSTTDRDRESASVYFSGGTGSESMEIDFDPFSTSPIVRARIDDVECEIQ
jgi:hypothetical protein